VTCGGALDGASGGGQVPSSPAPLPGQLSPTLPSNQTTTLVPSLEPQPGGQVCITFVSAVVNGAGLAGGEGRQLQLQLLNTYGLCPNTALPTAVALNPAVLAQQFWQTIPLPVPRPSVPPGYAVTGRPAYLVTGGTVAPAAYTEATPLGRLSVTATGSYQVSWGDGATGGPYAYEGEPYPDGSITHTYDNVGTVTVTVVEDWTATWSLGGATGTLRQLQTRATIPGFAVRQIQAVLTQ
jgi:hypothetical protein